MTTQYRANQLDDPRLGDIGRRGLYRVAGAAGSMAGLFLLAAMISLIVSVLRPDVSDSHWLSVQNIWLIVIFKLHAGFNGVHIEMLHVLNYLDLAILAIVATLHLGLFSTIQRTNRIWSAVAAIQPFLGMVIFLATKNAGRSGVMGATLVISLVMLQGAIFDKVTAYLGILASVLLLAGDLSAGAIPPTAVIATLVSIGYVFLMIWFFLVSSKLFQLGLGKRGNGI